MFSDSQTDKTGVCMSVLYPIYITVYNTNTSLHICY